ncbi:MAG: hypothetical protein ACK6EB_31235, partial [Planctomyces sp.]
MLLSPCKVLSGSTQGPFGVTIINPIDNRPWSCLYGVNNYDPGPPPALGDPIDCSRYINGQFIPRDVVSNSVCAPVPQTSMRIKTFDDGI